MMEAADLGNGDDLAFLTEVRLLVYVGSCELTTDAVWPRDNNRSIRTKYDVSDFH